MKDTIWVDATVKEYVVAVCGECPFWYDRTCIRKPGHRIDHGPILATDVPPGFSPLRKAAIYMLVQVRGPLQASAEGGEG